MECYAQTVDMLKVEYDFIWVQQLDSPPIDDPSRTPLSLLTDSHEICCAIKTRDRKYAPSGVTPREKKEFLREWELNGCGYDLGNPGCYQDAAGWCFGRLRRSPHPP
jgi:hypothetical protein